MAPAELAKVAQQYRDEGYDVRVRPGADSLPPFLVDFRPSLVALRSDEDVVVMVETDRIGLSRDDRLPRLAEVVNAQPGWRFDVVILEEETALAKAAQEAGEPSDEQLAQILKAAEELADKGYAPYAYVVAWSGLEAAMRRIRDEAELYGKTTPVELMRTLYGNGFLSCEQLVRLRESYKVRSQVVHGLVPSHVDPDAIRFVTATARFLTHDPEAIAQTN